MTKTDHQRPGATPEQMAQLWACDVKQVERLNRWRRIDRTMAPRGY